VAVYGSIALLLAAHFKARPLRVAIWSVAIALPLIVALARMYRGMHHPIDVTAGALMGVAALLIAMFAARTSRAAAEVRAGRRLETFS
jgi:undecaprenyl-diphosphatase